MDFLYLALSVSGLLCTFVFAFVVYQVLALALDYFRANGMDDAEVCDAEGLPCRFLWRIPSRALSALLVLCFLAMVL